MNDEWKERAELRCHILGHIWAGQSCFRCGIPDYAEEYYRPTLNLLPYFINIRWRVHLWKRDHIPHLREYCDDPACGRLMKILGVPVGQHKNCDPIPF